MSETSLAEDNERIHDALEDKLLGFYESVTALAWDEAKTRWEAWKTAFLKHFHFEDAELMPRLEALVAQHLPPDDKLDRQVDGDHKILERTIAKIDVALAARSATPDDRRALVRDLDTFLLLRRVLEHHTLRETRHAYPLLEEHLPSADRDAVHAGLLESGAP